MASVKLIKYPTTSPADTTPLARLKAEHGYEASDILGVVGKSEGNGCVNDFSRTLSAVVWEPAIPPTSIAVFSGGTEGVLCPHVTFVVKEKEKTGLVACVGRTEVIEAAELGRSGQVLKVATTVQKMMKDANLSANDVKLVLVKCPLLTSSKIETVRASGATPSSSDTYESMGKSRFASAIGIGVALGEIEDAQVADALAQEKVWSAKASCSSGAELEDCHILLLATPSHATEAPTATLRAASSFMKDAIDATAITKLLDEINRQNGRVVQVFVKAEADPTGLIRGQRHTMSGDSDLHSTRHARAAVGGLVAGLTSDTMVYVSGGAEGQGPIGGGSLCIVYEVVN